MLSIQHGTSRIPDPAAPMSFAFPDKRLHSLDTLRALAIILVFFSHYVAITLHNPVGALNRFGLMGVDLFFVLSGYLIAHHIFKSVAAQTFDLKEFYLRRSLRILPAYYAVLLIYFCFPMLQEKPVIAPLWKYLTLTMNYGLESSGFSHIWSLCLEEHFYILFPLLALAFLTKAAPRHLMHTLVFLVFGALCLRLYLFINIVEAQPTAPLKSLAYNTYIYYPGITRLDGVIFGALVAFVRNYNTALWDKLTGIKRGDIHLLCGIAILALCSAIEQRQSLEFLDASAGYTLKSLGCTFLLLAALSRNCILYKIRIPGAETLAILSFAIYLIHKMTIYASLQLFSNTLGLDKTGVPFTVIATGVTLLAAWILYKGIEQPFLKLREKLTGTPDLAPAEAATLNNKSAASP